LPDVPAEGGGGVNAQLSLFPANYAEAVQTGTVRLWLDAHVCSPMPDVALLVTPAAPEKPVTAQEAA
jgi:hypothetical protein